jgi:hypothetical protein
MHPKIISKDVTGVFFYPKIYNQHDNPGKRCFFTFYSPKDHENVKREEYIKLYQEFIEENKQAVYLEKCAQEKYEKMYAQISGGGNDWNDM